MVLLLEDRQVGVVLVLKLLFFLVSISVDGTEGVVEEVGEFLTVVEGACA